LKVKTALVAAKGDRVGGWARKRRARLAFDVRSRPWKTN